MSEIDEENRIKDKVKTDEDMRAKHSPITPKKEPEDTVAEEVKSANGMTNFSDQVSSENEDEFIIDHSGRTFDHVNDDERSNKNEDSMTDTDDQYHHHKNESGDRTSYYMSDNKSAPTFLSDSKSDCHNISNSKACEYGGSKTVTASSRQVREPDSKTPENFLGVKSQDDNQDEEYLEVDTHAMDLSLHSRHSDEPTLSKPCIAQDKGKANTVHKDMNATHTCSLCGSGFTTRLFLDTHMQNQHPEDFTPVLQENTIALDLSKSCDKVKASDEKPFKCQECGLGFNVNLNLQKHMRIHTGDLPYHCKECGKTFTDFNKYHGHMKRHTGEKPFACHVCQKTFDQKSKLLKHMRVHTGEKPFSCNECDKKFSESSSLHNHMRTHTLEKPFICFECGKSFSESSSLHKHIKIHTGEKPFVCKICGKPFSVDAKLQEHQRTHTGEKPYKCNECGRTFGYNHGLRRHMRTHTGEKPFACTECGRRFVQISNLHKHIKIHTGEKAFQCGVCGKDFTESTCLYRHMRIHTGEKPFICTECGRCFSDSSHLNRHMKTHNRTNTSGTLQIRGTPEVYGSQSLFRTSLRETSGVSTSSEDYGSLPIHGASNTSELAQVSEMESSSGSSNTLELSKVSKMESSSGSPNNFDV